MLKDLMFAGMHAALSYITPGSNANAKALYQDLGDFCKGVCHPLDERIHELRDANIGWVRFDINGRPLDETGNETPGYRAFKERARLYRDAGYRIMAVTPFPQEYSQLPFSPTSPEYREKIIGDIRYLAADLQELVSVFQIANEMQVEHFRFPLSVEESIDFLGIQLEALSDTKGRIKVGFNLQDFSMVSYLRKMRPYIQYCDYIGLDLYLGCFETMTKDLYWYDFILRFIWHYTKKPVWVAEFGYMGAGVPKTDTQKQAILQSYGADSEAEASANIRNFVRQLPPQFRDHLLHRVEHKTDEELAHKLFHTELRNHLYRELPSDVRLRHYAHTREDQARFITDTIRRFRRLPFVCGAFVYCYSDSPECFICGQSDCPVETGWGLVDVKGQRKPAWYAVRDAFRE